MGLGRRTLAVGDLTVRKESTFMWIYEKKLQFPVNIKKSDPATARIIISQLGGPDGELAASMRYLNQRYSMPYREISGVLTDIGTEELAHLEMVGTILYQLTRCLDEREIKESGFDTYFVDHTTGVYPQAASGVPTDMKYIGVKGDVIADLHEDLAADGAIAKEQHPAASPHTPTSRVSSDMLRGFLKHERSVRVG